MTEPLIVRTYTAEEIANAQLHAFALNRYAVRRALNALKPDEHGLFTLVYLSECDRFAQMCLAQQDEAALAQTRYGVRVHCRPRHFCFTTASFEDAVAYSAPFEPLFSVTITAF